LKKRSKKLYLLEKQIADSDPAWDIRRIIEHTKHLSSGLDPIEFREMNAQVIELTLRPRRKSHRVGLARRNICKPIRGRLGARP